MEDVHSVLKLWPDFDAVAADCDVSKDAVWQWVKRGHIPPRQNPKLIESAKGRGIEGISFESLAPLNVPQE